MTLERLDAKSDLFEAFLQSCLLDIADIHYSNGIPTWLVGLKFVASRYACGFYQASWRRLPGSRVSLWVHPIRLLHRFGEQQ
jgi:hypothetical protein